MKRVICLCLMVLACGCSITSTATDMASARREFSEIKITTIYSSTINHVYRVHDELLPRDVVYINVQGDGEWELGSGYYGKVYSGDGEIELAAP